MKKVLFSIKKSYTPYFILAIETFKKQTRLDVSKFFIEFSYVQSENPIEQSYFEIWFYPFDFTEDYMNQQRGINYIIQINKNKKILNFQTYRD